MNNKEPPAAMKGKNVSLMHLENRLKHVRLLTEQVKLTEEGRRIKSSLQHASGSSPASRLSRPATEAGRKKEAIRDRSTSAKPSTQPSTSKEPVRTEVKRRTEERRKTPERRSTAKTRDTKMESSPYAAKRSAESPASSTESIQRLLDEVKRLKAENQKLRGKVEVDLSNSQDLKEWPRKDLLKLIAQLESKEVRKPVQAAVKKLQEMGDTMSLHDQLKLARETVESLKQQNLNLREELTIAKSTPTPPLAIPSSLPVRDRPTVPRLDMGSLHNSADSPEKNGTNGDEADVSEAEMEEQNGHTEVQKGEAEPVITDPSLMPRWEYEQIACDIVHATRAAILRKRFMERWKKDREDVEERRPKK